MTDVDVQPCLSSSAESTLEKMWPAEPLPVEKSLNVPPPRCILHNLVHPGGNVEYLIFPVDFLNFNRYDITRTVFGVC